MEEVGPGITVRCCSVCVFLISRVSRKKTANKMPASINRYIYAPPPAYGDAHAGIRFRQSGTALSHVSIPPKSKMARWQINEAEKKGKYTLKAKFRGCVRVQPCHAAV